MLHGTFVVLGGLDIRTHVPTSRIAGLILEPGKRGSCTAESVAGREEEVVRVDRSNRGKAKCKQAKKNECLESLENGLRE